MRTIITIAGIIIAFGVGVLAGLTTPNAQAADHVDAPVLLLTPAADLADLYAWHDAEQLTIALTFAGLREAGLAAPYDPNLLYAIHIDEDGDSAADQVIWIRFGQDALGNWGVQLSGVPGVGEQPIVAPVDTVLTVEGAKIYAGLRDDPFFFDIEGWLTSLTTHELAFDGARDSLAGTNAVAIVLQLDLLAVTQGNEWIQVWASVGQR
ncbi:MAG: DUF4331 domain-containing protein [Deltaproteobacteria bacterium]|nr:DUF4331 domain-containing protein [Deltaproteobacteria bacterium]